MKIKVEFDEEVYVVIDTDTNGNINPNKVFLSYENFLRWDEENPLKNGSRVLHKVPFGEAVLSFRNRW